MTSQNQGLVSFQSIGSGLARTMVAAAISAAGKHGRIEKGFCVVIGLKDQTRPLATGGFGDFSTANFEIAHAKTRTALATGRSTLEQARHVDEDGTSREDYAGSIETLFGGGVLVTNSEGQVVGAIAWSGAAPEDDIAVCERAIEENNLSVWSED